jgi:hypothetical protein
VTIRAFCMPVLLAFLLAAAPFPGPMQAQELEWVRSGTGVWSSRGIAVDPRGNSYVTGSFEGPVTFGAGEANETELTAGGFSDIFIAKYAPDGRLLWVRRAGGGPDDSSSGSGIAADPRGNSYVTGQFGSRFFLVPGATAIFGAGEANETELTAAGSTGIFIAKYAPDGRLLWVKGAHGGPDGSSSGRGIAVDPRGNSYVTGQFGRFSPGATTTFGAGEPNETTLTAAGDSDIFVAKYAPDGRLLWAKGAGNLGIGAWGSGIAVDPRGNSYVSCNGFEGSDSIPDNHLIFGAGEANETVIEWGACIAKYGSDGRLLWARTSSPRPEHEVGGRGIAVDPRGNSYLTGDFQSLAIFGVGEPNETTLGGTGFINAFIAKYTPDGNLLWARSGSVFDDDAASASSVAVDPRGHSSVTGSFDGRAIFGAGEPNETTLTAVGGTDIFVAKYAPDGRLLWAGSATASSGGTGIAVDPRGNGYVTGGGIFVGKYRDRRGR